MKTTRTVPSVLWLPAAALFLLTLGPASATSQSSNPNYVPRAWYQQRCLNVPPNTVQFYDHDHFQANGDDYTLSQVTSFPVNTFQSLKRTPIHDEMTSLKWSLPVGVVVILYEHTETHKLGRQYTIWGEGQDGSVKEDAFSDKLSGWAWFYVGP